MIGNCGFICSTIISKNKMNFNINKLVKNNYIICEGNYLVYGVAQKIYILSSLGKEYLRKEFDMTIYKSDINQLEHDYILLKTYMELEEIHQDSWLNETALKKMFKTLYTSDGLFSLGEKLIGVEVITNSYSQCAIDGKLEFIKKYCDDKIIVHTNKGANKKYESV